jgi:hypothetical protein
MKHALIKFRGSENNRHVFSGPYTDNSLPGCLGIIVTCTCTVLLYFAVTKDKFGSFLKKLFHSSTSHTYHHNSSWTIRQARNYLWVLNQMPCLFQISLTGSCYTTIAITIERFLAIRLPFFIQKHNVKARVFILPIVIYCLVYNSPRFFEYEILYLGCVDFKNGSYSTLEYDQANNITCEFVYTLDYSEMRKTQLYISVITKLFKIVWPWEG